eukprot:1978691-Amphidinium_carterae.3
MEANLNLQATHDLVEVEAQAQTYYHSRWSHLEQQAQIEYIRSWMAQLDAVGRFESILHGFNQANTRATMLQMELDQARRQHHVQSTCLRNELQAAQTQNGHPEKKGPVSARVRAKQSTTSSTAS